MPLLEVDKAFTKILSEYIDYTNIFLFKLIVELLKHNSINDYTIKLIEDK